MPLSENSPTISNLNKSNLKELSQEASKADISRSAVVIGILIGLALNWLALYLNIILGLLSIGISSFVVLLVTKLFLREKATQSNLALVSVAYGATSAAEASVGLLFVIWLYNNASSFGVTFDAPSWLLPSDQVIAERIIFTTEWIIPLLIHYFLMFVPGITGLILGIYLAPKFLNNDEEYPFPGTIRRSKELEVLVTNERSKVYLFIRFLAIGFIVAFITLFFPVIDLSNIGTGLLFGIMLGTIGVTMFAVGFVVNNPKITIPAGIASIIMYTIISPLVVDTTNFQTQVALGNFQDNFFGFYSYLLQSVFLSFLIGFILSAAIISPFVWGILKKSIKKMRSINNSNNVNSKDEVSSHTISSDDQPDNKVNENIKKAVSEEEIDSRKSNRFKKFKQSIGKQELMISITYIVALFLSFLFVSGLQILPEGTELIVIILLLVWILFLGSLIQGYIVVSTVAKSATAVTPPFIFDMLPLFLVGARGMTPYIATPKGEIGETMGIVSTLKFAQQMEINRHHTLLAYLAGYFTAALTTPFFTLFLWKALGIGTVNFPAPGFPIMLAMVGPFAAGAIELFLNIGELILGGVAALIFPSIGISLAIGMFFPPHMALTLTLGGLTALFFQRKYGKEWMNDRGKVIATAISVGATFTVPILILLNLLAI